MTLARYDSELMEMMYLLTRKQSHMNPAAVARYLAEKGINVTDRTVRRWFDYLHTHRFDYFPYPKYESLGLVPVWVLTDFNEKVLEAVPHKAAIVHGLDFRTLEKCLLCLYLVPADRVREFKKIWSDAAGQGTLKFCNVFEINSATAFYSPFHTLIDKNGIVNFPPDYAIDNSYFTKMLNDSIHKKRPVAVNRRIIENPLIVPIIMECFRKHMSSQKIWKSFEKRAGEAAWSYINNPKIRRKKINGCGIKCVQNAMREMQDNFGEFFQQMRISYYPFYRHHNNVFYMILKLKSRDDIVPLSETLSRHAISIVAYPPGDEKSSIVMYYVLTDSMETLNITNKLLQPYLDKSFDNKIIFEDFHGTAKYRDQNLRYWNEHCIMSNYHTLFNPATCTWKFDAKTYAKKLNAAVMPR